MARLDRAIHEKSDEFSMDLDGRVEPGHDSRTRCQFFHTLEGGHPSLQNTAFSHRLTMGFSSYLVTNMNGMPASFRRSLA
jgi:hypothetical protein